VLPSVGRIMYFQHGDCHGGRKRSVSHGVIIRTRYSLRSETGWAVVVTSDVGVV
jgi:hypothetical protein